MKRKALSFIIALFMIFLSLGILSFAADVPYVGYFQVLLTKDGSRDIESTLQSFSHGCLGEICDISAPDGSGAEQKMLIVYVKQGEAPSELYSYLFSHPAVESVLPDFKEIEENVRAENELQKISYVRPYDLDADGNVTAEDARLALRAAVGLEEIPAFAVRAANYGEIYPMSSRIARRILRASVGLEHIPIFEINVATHGEKFVIGPIECHGAAGFDIKLGGDTDKFTVDQKCFGADTLAVGGPVRCYYIFTPLEEGSFKLTFTYEDIKYKVPSVVDEFTVEIHHVYREIKEPDFIFS